MEPFVFWIGIAAATAITGANVPQAIKIFRTGDTKSISAMTYTLLVVGNLLWLVYGILNEDIPIILSNAIATLLCCGILLVKVFPAVLVKIKKGGKDT